MSRGTIAAFILVLIGAFALIYYWDDVKDFDLSGTSTKTEVNFSVVRYEGKAVSIRLVINGSGKLENRHRIPESIGVAYYKQEELIKQIQNCDSYRYISTPDNSGFTHEVVVKTVSVR